MDKLNFESLYKGESQFNLNLHNRCAKSLHRQNQFYGHLSGKQMQGLKFRRQHPLDNFILDFYCHEIKLSIELDGKIHQNELQATYDKERTKCLQDKGINELRFKNETINRITDALNEIEKTIRQIKRKQIPYQKSSIAKTSPQRGLGRIGHAMPTNRWLSCVFGKTNCRIV